MDDAQTFVLDTNVLLADPESLFAFPGARVVIPETVLGEIDKLKTARADQDLRYRGREVSRALFELSEHGLLTEGVPMKDGGELLVARLDHDGQLPSEYNGKSSDDRILAVAYQLAQQDHGVTLVTNDLNMLLKAQAVHLPVKRYGEESERPFMTRVAKVTWQRNRIPILTAVAVLLAFLAAFVLVKQFVGVSVARNDTATLPPEIQSLLPHPTIDLFQNLQALQQNPNDMTALISIGNIYYDMGVSQRNLGYIQKAATYYERALQITPSDAPVGTDLAVSYYYLGQYDKALIQIQRVIKFSPRYALAHLNYGIILQNAKKDYPGAAEQFRTVLTLVPATDQLAAEAKQRLTSVEASISGSKT